MESTPSARSGALMAMAAALAPVHPGPATFVIPPADPPRPPKERDREAQRAARKKRQARKNRRGF